MVTREEMVERALRLLGELRSADLLPDDEDMQAEADAILEAAELHAADGPELPHRAALEVAAAAVAALGGHVVARNVRLANRQVDLVVDDGKTRACAMLLLEVEKRSETAASSVAPAEVLQRYGCESRSDLVFVRQSADGCSVTAEWIKGAR